MPATILLVDDTSPARQALRQILVGAGYAVAEAGTAAEARRLAATDEPALAVLDLVLPDGDGIGLLEELRALWPGLPALMVTGYAEPRSIVEAMRRGAHDYLIKPIDPELFLSACRAAARIPAPPASRESVAARLPALGASAAMAGVRETLTRLSRGRPTGVLLVGEIGVGKGWLARALHAGSARHAAPCLEYACGEDADATRDLLGGRGGGLLAAAAGGTVILRDVERLPAELGERLVDAVERAGGTGPQLAGLTTRADAGGPLLGWLGRARIVVPPLRERSADILSIAGRFLDEQARALGRVFDGFTSAAERALLAQAWPGNVAELRATVRRAAEMAPGGAVGAEHFAHGGDAASWTPGAGLPPLRDVTDSYIDHVLAVTGGNRTRAAQILGVARETLRTRILARHALR